MIGLFRYFIEGFECAASGLNISRPATPKLRQTQEGFECNAFFQPELLTKKILEDKEVINGRVLVDMTIMYDDILMIHGLVKGEQVTLLH